MQHQEYCTALRYYILPHVVPLSRIPHETRGKAELRDGEYLWIRQANDEFDRAARRHLVEQTWQAIQCKGYRFEGTNHFVCFRHLESCWSGTQLLSPTAAPETWPLHLGGHVQLPLDSWTERTELIVAKNVVFAECEKQASEYRVAAVNAASAYHLGGGYRTGGRHALEEAMCTQSTLCHSMARLEEEPQGFPVPPWAQPARCRDGSDWHQHLPQDGVLLSPKVEIFREGSDMGYAFKDEIVQLEAVISVAMPNCNERMSDSPVDRHPDPENYVAQLQERWTAVLASAAFNTEADCLVVPDAGCGVFRNSPAHVGHVLGRLLRSTFQGRFKRVVLTFPGGQAGEEFAKFAMAAFHGEELALPYLASLKPQAYSSSRWQVAVGPPPPPPPASAEGVVPSPLLSTPASPRTSSTNSAGLHRSGSGSTSAAMAAGSPSRVTWEYSVSRGWDPFDESASRETEEAYQRYKRGGSATALVPSGRMVIVVDFERMTQHLEGTPHRRRTLRRREDVFFV